MAGGINPYVYANLNPTNLTDPYGLVAGVDDLGIVIVAGGALIIGSAYYAMLPPDRQQAMENDVHRFWDWLWNENTEDGGDSCPVPESDRDKSVKRKPIKTGQDALDQLEGIEKAQANWKKGKRKKPIDFIDKSKQRFKNRIKNYKTPKDFYDDFD